MALIVDFETKMGELLLNQKGNTVLIDICQANCICAFIHTYKEEDGSTIHQLHNFLVDRTHIKNLLEGKFSCDLLYGTIEQISLNLYYPNAAYVLEYFTKKGYEVNCYYKKPIKHE